MCVCVVGLAAVAEPPEDAPPVFRELTGDIALRDAVAAALQNNPRLAAFAWEIRATEAEIMQAGLRPNPELDIEIEGIRWEGGPSTTAREGMALSRESGAESGFSESELTISLSQIIELGGKRTKRIALADSKRDLAQWDYEAVRADVLVEVARAFQAVLFAQERLKLHEELETLATDVAQSIEARVEAGEVSPLEGDRANIALATERVELAQAKRDMESARTRLAATWGSSHPEFASVAGNATQIAPVPDAEAIAKSIQKNPDLARWTTELAVRRSQTELARAQRIPDPTLSFGYRTEGLADRSVTTIGTVENGISFADVEPDRSRDDTLVLGLSIPLPIFDRNQGNVAAAEFRESRAAANRQATELTIHTQVHQAREIAAGAFEEATTLEKSVLSVAETTFDKTRKGYELGKFGYIDVLEAQRTLVQARTSHLDALERYHGAMVELDRLTGAQLDDFVQETTHE
jgi:cobalt-zinc-cadmium efflux system outer membrane protein